MDKFDVYGVLLELAEASFTLLVTERNCRGDGASGGGTGRQGAQKGKHREFAELG